MVHALQESMRVLKASGWLIDLRPNGPDQTLALIRDGEEVIAGEIDTSVGNPDDEAAHRAVAALVRRAAFRQVERTNFIFTYDWDSLDQMRAYVETEWSEFAAIPENTWRQAHQIITAVQPEGNIVRIKWQMHLAIYQKT
jgi:hypothetical protein